MLTSRQGLRWRGAACAVWLAALLVGVWVRPAQALDPSKRLTQYHRQVWTTVEGLPQGSVQAIAQTRDGYLWVGTRAGLARFNGETFTVFDPADTPGLEGRNILTLYAAPDGSLWIGSDGMGITRLADGRFTTLGSESLLLGASGNGIRADTDGRVWIGTWTGVVRLDGSTARRFQVEDGLPQNEVNDLVVDTRNTVWVASLDGLAEIREDRVMATHRGLSGEPLCLLLDRGGRMWIGTSGGLDLYENGRLVRLRTDDGLLADFVTALVEDRHGAIWIGTEGGLNRYSDGRLEGMSAREAFPMGVVASLLEDREGNIWVGLKGMGLVRLRDGALTTFTREEGLAEDNVGCVFQSRDGSLWFGTGGGLTRYRDGEYRVFTRRDGLVADAVSGIGEHSQLGLLVATFSRKLNVIRGDRVSVFEPLEIANTIPSVIHEDRSGALWVGTLGAGLYRVDGPEVQHFPFDGSNGRHVIYGLYEAPDGVIWFATSNGLLRYADGTFEPRRVYDLGENFGVVHAIFPGDTGALWIGTRDRGVCRFRDGGTSRCFGRAEGLADDTIYGVLGVEDALWVSSPTGIARVFRDSLDHVEAGDQNKLSARSFSVADGMKSAECNGMRWPAGCRDTEGRLWFPTSKGVVMVEPDRLDRAVEPPPLAIEEVWAEQRSHPPAEQVRLPPGRGDLEIRYAGLDYSAPETTRFRVQLLGRDAGWREVGGRRRATYTNIPPGRYTFRVAASSDGHTWGEPRSLQLVLEPHFYQTSVWYAVLALLGVVILYSGYRLRVRRLRKQAEALAQKVSEALADVKVLSGLLPICSGCKRIRSDEGYWEQIEAYIHEHSEAGFSHGICPDCAHKLYPEHAEEALDQADEQRSARAPEQ